MTTTGQIDTEAISIAINKALLQDIAAKPSIRVLNLDDISLEDVEEFLLSRHSQEFGRFGIFDSKDRKNVAQWFVRQMMEFYDYRSGIPR